MTPILPSLFALAVAAGAPTAPRTVDDALQAAAAEKRPLLLDFQAQWCYSCYYMATHVLNGAQWQSVERRAGVLEVDGDAPEGAAWMQKLAIRALPSYVVLRPDGSELGRIVGEQARDTFYRTLDKILAGSDALESLKAGAEQGSLPALAGALAAFEARGEIDAGLAWYSALPGPVRAAGDKDEAARLRHDRLLLERAVKAGDGASCLAAAKRVLAADVGCDRYYVVDNVLGCSESLAAPQRKALLAAQRPALLALIDRRVLVADPSCADQRSAIITAADLDRALGDEPAETAVLDRAIAYARTRLHGDVGQDRNLADNLRVYLKRAGRTAEHDALLTQLIAAYPDDYVYAYHFGRTWLDRRRPEKALPYLEQAAPKTFGANRLMVAELRAKALIKLNRRDEAKQVVAAALEANGPWFPQSAAKLGKLVAP